MNEGTFCFSVDHRGQRYVYANFIIKRSPMSDKRFFLWIIGPRLLIRQHKALPVFVDLKNQLFWNLCHPESRAMGMCIYRLITLREMEYAFVKEIQSFIL